MIRNRPITAASRCAIIVASVSLGVATCASALSPRFELPYRAIKLEGTGLAPANDIGDDVYNVGGSIQPPVATYTPDPKYPKEARKARSSGKVVISLIVGENGRPRDVHVIKSAGMGFDENALKAVQRYRFQPAAKDGSPVAVYVNVEVEYKYIP